MAARTRQLLEWCEVAGRVPRRQMLARGREGYTAKEAAMKPCAFLLHPFYLLISLRLPEIHGQEGRETKARKKEGKRPDARKPPTPAGFVLPDARELCCRE